MDILELQKSREDSLSDFKKTYSNLNQEYSIAIHAAITEEDPASQAELVQKVLDINAELSSAVRDMLTQMNQKTVDSKTLNELTNDLVKYQKEYQEIKQGKDKLTTLKMMYGSTSKKLEDAQLMYNIYFYALIVAIGIVILLIFGSSIQTLFSTPAVGGLRLLRARR